MPDVFVVLFTLVAVGMIALRLFVGRPRVSVREADVASRSGVAVIVDVREPSEWVSGVADGAELLPLSDLRGSRVRWDPALKKHRGRRLLLYCRSGMRSSHAATLLRREGIDAANIGSFAAWKRAGLPTRKP